MRTCNFRVLQSTQQKLEVDKKVLLTKNENSGNRIGRSWKLGTNFPDELKKMHRHIPHRGKRNAKGGSSHYYSGLATLGCVFYLKQVDHKN